MTANPIDIHVGKRLRLRRTVLGISQEKLAEIVAKAEELYQKEENMVAEIRTGKSMIEVDQKYSYEKMLK